MTRTITLNLTRSELVLLKDAIELLDPVYDDPDQQEIAINLCDDISEKLEKAIDEIGV